VFHKTTPELYDQDQDRSVQDQNQDQDHSLQDQDQDRSVFWSQTGLVLKPTGSDHITGYAHVMLITFDVTAHVGDADHRAPSLIKFEFRRCSPSEEMSHFLSQH